MNQAVESARAAGLRYVGGADPGIRRRRAGEAFRYLHPDGRAVRDQATLARIRRLAIPPAWTEVWICAAADGHLQAGRIASPVAGRSEEAALIALLRGEQRREDVSSQEPRIPRAAAEALYRAGPRSARAHAGLTALGVAARLPARCAFVLAG